MGLAMKTACCGKSLRAVSLILLYVHLIVNGWGLLSLLANTGTSSYSQIYGSSSISNLLDIIAMVIGCIIYFGAIVTIYREKPSLPLLTAAVWFLIVSSVFTVYALIVVDATGALEVVYFTAVDNQAKELPPHDREVYKEKMKKYYSNIIFFVHLVLLAVVAFKLYSALVFHSYKEDLKTRPVYGVPPRQNAADKEANTSAPYPPTGLYAAPQYPTQSAPYPAVFPQYPNQQQQQPQYPYPPAQNYPQAPPPYETDFK